MANATPSIGSIKVNLELTIDQVNVCLGSLAKQPYEVVAELIVGIKAQAQEQISKQTAKDQDSPVE